MGLTYVLDTNVILYLLGGRVARPLPEGRYVASVITEIELLSYPWLSTQEEDAVRAFLADVELAELSLQVRKECVSLRRSMKLSVPDAIIAATALALNAELITNDRRLCAMAQLSTRQVELKQE